MEIGGKLSAPNFRVFQHYPPIAATSAVFGINCIGRGIRHTSRLQYLRERPLAGIWISNDAAVPLIPEPDLLAKLRSLVHPAFRIT